MHARIRAREEARQVPREFVLYAPSATEQKTKSRGRAVDVGVEPPGVLRTTSLPLILQGLNKALKDRTRRTQSGAKSLAAPGAPEAGERERDAIMAPARHHDYMLPAEASAGPSGGQYPVLEDARMRRRGRKGKHRSDVVPAPVAPIPPRMSRDASGSGSDKAWWLDISSPTWEDMRTIGKVRFGTLSSYRKSWSCV